MLKSIEILMFSDGWAKGIAVEDTGEEIDWYAVKRSDGLFTVSAWYKDERKEYSDQLGLEDIRKSVGTALD